MFFCRESVLQQCNILRCLSAVVCGTAPVVQRGLRSRQQIYEFFWSGGKLVTAGLASNWSCVRNFVVEKEARTPLTLSYTDCGLFPYSLLPHWLLYQGSFRGERVGTPFPLLVFKNTLRHCEPFPEQNTLDYRISHIQCQMFSRGDTLGTRRSALGAWTTDEFLLGSPAFPSFLFYESTTVLRTVYHGWCS